MIGMQYRITLPSDYNMEKIKDRIKENGCKTDGFMGLLFKCYLIQEKNIDDFENVYAPLYIWEKSEGMNKFIFEGYFDNIIQSFGWKEIIIGIPFCIDISENLNEAKYLLELVNPVTPEISLKGFQSKIPVWMEDEDNIVGRVILYNPDKWNYCQYIFCKNKPKTKGNDLYQILHISKR